MCLLGLMMMMHAVLMSFFTEAFVMLSDKLVEHGGVATQA
jgi:hypothetical protein